MEPDWCFLLAELLYPGGCKYLRLRPYFRPSVHPQNILLSLLFFWGGELASKEKQPEPNQFGASILRQAPLGDGQVECREGHGLVVVAPGQLFSRGPENQAGQLGALECENTWFYEEKHVSNKKNQSEHTNGVCIYYILSKYSLWRFGSPPVIAGQPPQPPESKRTWRKLRLKASGDGPNPPKGYILSICPVPRPYLGFWRSKAIKYLGSKGLLGLPL